MSESFYSHLILDDNFNLVVSELEKNHINSMEPINYESDKYNDNLESDNIKIEFLETDKVILNAANGNNCINKFSICSYDESIVKFPALEGTGFLLSHSLVLIDKDSYIPMLYLSFNFYTKSKSLSNKNSAIKYSESPEVDSKSQYSSERSYVLTKFTPKNSIIFIDGPLIGGQISSATIKMSQALTDKNVFPVFFVKNSDSSLVIDNTEKLHGKYNSDFEWAFKYLKNGERTPFVKYTDKDNNKNVKIFTYIKLLNMSPLRIEFHEDAYNKFKAIIPEIMDVIYYLYLAQGNTKNMQIRPIAIAETFAREILKTVDVDNLMHKTGITPTMNYTRFGW